MATPGLDLKLLPGADGQNSDQRHWPANGGEGLAPHLTTRPDEAPAATQWSDRVGDRPERCRARSRCMRLSCCLLFCGCRHRNRPRPSRSKSRSCWTRMRRLVNSLAPRLRQTKASQETRTQSLTPRCPLNLDLRRRRSKGRRTKRPLRSQRRPRTFLNLRSRPPLPRPRSAPPQRTRWRRLAPKGYSGRPRAISPADAE